MRFYAGPTLLAIELGYLPLPNEAACRVVSGRLATMYFRNETLAPIIRDQVPTRGNQCRQTERVDGRIASDFALNVACPMSLRGNDFHIAVLLNVIYFTCLKNRAEQAGVFTADTQCAPGQLQ